MSEEPVVFNKDGTYTMGQQLQDMDVTKEIEEKEGSKVEDNSKKVQKAGSTKKTSAAFDLSKLKSKVESKQVKTPETKPEEKPLKTEDHKGDIEMSQIEEKATPMNLEAEVEVKTKVENQPTPVEETKSDCEYTIVSAKEILSKEFGCSENLKQLAPDVQKALQSIGYARVYGATTVYGTECSGKTLKFYQEYITRKGNRYFFMGWEKYVFALYQTATKLTDASNQLSVKDGLFVLKDQKDIPLILVKNMDVPAVEFVSGKK